MSKTIIVQHCTPVVICLKKPRLKSPKPLLQVALLQETVRRECQERGDLTVALARAREQPEQGQRRSPAPPRPLPSRPQHAAQERPGSLGGEERGVPPRDPGADSHARHSRKPQQNPSPPPHGGEGGRARGTAWREDGGEGAGEAGRWGEKGKGKEEGEREKEGEARGKGRPSVGNLPRLRASGATREIQRKVSLMMGRTDRA
ncbi:hypothetical protein NHX12_008967 [Muraenolepis orangiensis]|uniref:Uncharacterized protein n=1 Tax=Muraenolepis orangiensis TaxID=630683 RepID=A0A9Q0DPW0_9TELE|nr:hypothetical protein NHX12_008967 [Muraenolepis orangiensis]